MNEPIFAMASVLTWCLRVSVCHICTFCRNEKTYLQNFSPFVSQAILVFPYQTSWHYSDGNPLKGASNARGYEKMTIFDQ